MTVKLCTEIGFKGDKKKFAGAVDNLAKRQFYGPVKSVLVSGNLTQGKGRGRVAWIISSQSAIAFVPLFIKELIHFLVRLKIKNFFSILSR